MARVQVTATSLAGLSPCTIVVLSHSCPQTPVLRGGQMVSASINSTGATPAAQRARCAGGAVRPPSSRLARCDGNDSIFISFQLAGYGLSTLPASPVPVLSNTTSRLCKLQASYIRMQQHGVVAWVWEALAASSVLGPPRC